MGNIELLKEHIIEDIKQLSEDFVKELVHYADYLVEKNKAVKSNGKEIKQLFGTLRTEIDGLEFQNKMRDEWD